MHSCACYANMRLPTHCVNLLNTVSSVAIHAQEASELQARVGKLEQSTAALATALERMSDDMRGIPRMLKLLANAGAVGGAQHYQPGRQSFMEPDGMTSYSEASVL
jgi:hypothetical protein